MMSEATLSFASKSLSFCQGNHHRLCSHFETFVSNEQNWQATELMLNSILALVVHCHSKGRMMTNESKMIACPSKDLWARNGVDIAPPAMWRPLE